MASQAAASSIAVDVNALAFQFVEQLAKEVSTGRVELPAFPDVAVRVRKVLADENVSMDQIARVITSDPGLTARVLALANSAALRQISRTGSLTWIATLSSPSKVADAISGISRIS